MAVEVADRTGRKRNAVVAIRKDSPRVGPDDGRIVAARCALNRDGLIVCPVVRLTTPRAAKLLPAEIGLLN